MIDAIAKLSRNTLFRLTGLAAFLFVLSSLVTLGYIYYATISADLRRVDEALIAEITEFEKIYNSSGDAEVGREILLRMSAGEGLYFFDHGNNIQTGNLGNEIIQLENTQRGFLPGRTNEYTKIEFNLTTAFDDQGRPVEGSDFVERRARGLSTLFFKGGEPTASITVARDVETTMRNGERIRTAILTSAGIALFLGLLSGWFVSRRFSRRIEAFNRLATDVRAGNMSVRAGRNYSEDELDLLAEHLNDMLDHIDRLMSAMRYAGDSIAHDLRSPLTRLRTRLEGAAQIADGEAQKVLLEASDDAAGLLKTFDSVLRIARLESADRREVLLPIDLQPILDDLAELYEPACEDAGLRLSTQIMPGLWVRADRGLISQAVSNLVENSIKYARREGGTDLQESEMGRVVIALKRGKSGRVELSISDDGPGIPDHMRERVKERFVRLEASRTAPGSGLGLALVDAVVEVHGADLILSDGLGDEVEGETPGLRTTLVFPRARANRLPSVGEKTGTEKPVPELSVPSPFSADQAAQ